VVDDLQQAGQDYPEPTLTLFSGTVRSACGNASSASGPFYCPADQNLYIDLKFYDELRQRFGAPGDFAQAYVLAHEVGHHVQNVLGVLQKTQGQGNEASIRTELQADCYAGIWANHTEQKGLSRRATSTRRLPPQPRWATTPSSSVRKAM
jgi:predicted metalloprotease